MSDSRSRRITEGQRLRDLGHYGRALASFQDAEDESSDLKLATEISATMVEQGCFGKAREKISRALHHLSDTTDGESATAMAEILEATITAIVSGKFSASLSTATRRYNQCLMDHPVEEYSKAMIAMELVYYRLTELATSMGVQHSCPKTGTEKLDNLFHHAMSKDWFAEAQRIAGLYSDGSVAFFFPTGTSLPTQKPDLLEHLLGNTSIPDIVRAEALVTLSDMLREKNQTERSEELAEEAKKLFEKSGHACGALLIEIGWCRQPSSRKTPSKRIRRLSEINALLEEDENWAGVGQVARAMYDVALEISDTKLKEKLDHECLRLKDISGSPMTWFSWQLLVFSRWDYSGGNTGKMIVSLEALYDTLGTMELPRLKDMAAFTMMQACEKVGDNAQAALWKAKVQGLLTQIEAMSLDPFMRDLESTTSAPDENLAFQQLHEALKQISYQTSEVIPMSERWVGVMKVSHMCDIYMNQVQFRGLETTKTLVKTCLEVAKPALQRISTEQSKRFSGGMMQIEARLVFIEACIGGSSVNVSTLEKALEKYEHVVSYYRKAGLSDQAAFTLGFVANCHEKLWFLSGRRSNSEYFRSAISAYVEAGNLLQKHGFADGLRLNLRLRLRLWLSGYQAKVELWPGRIWSSIAWFLSWLGFKKNSPFRETIRVLKSLEMMVDRQRHDLVALPTERAVLAKQSLRKSDDVRAMVESAITIYAMENDITSVWEAVQKSKSRSVSDLLGLGINIPQHLMKRVNEDPEAALLIEKESMLLQEVGQDSTDHQFQLRRDLDAHRRVMRHLPCLQEVLELREGSPISIAKLRALSDSVKASDTKRQIFFADWIIQFGKLWLLVVTPDGIPIYELGVLTGEITKWKEEHLSSDEPLNDDGLEPLQELSKLIEPLVNLSKEGDLLVLCATDQLHSVPLHAATITKDSKKSLIERNPIVYCPSMTVFEQCVRRASDRGGSDGKPEKQTLLSVYEKPVPDIDDWQEQRDEAYEMCRDLGSNSDLVKVLTGAEVDKARFRSECEDAKIVHFLGHCEAESGELPQHLLLCASQHENAGPAASILPSGPFTISDIFATPIRTSHFNLIACGSASQSISVGDEPMGVVAALLCAGATSVGGTMWPIDVGTGRLFMQGMYHGLSDGADGEARAGSEVVDLAVALQRQVVEMKRDIDMREPWYWAGFVLHGSWFYR